MSFSGAGANLGRGLCLGWLVVALVLLSTGAKELDGAAPTAGMPPDPHLAADEKLLRDNSVPVDGPGLMDFIRNRFSAPLDDATIKALIEQLGHESFTKREEASRQLVTQGPRAKKHLQTALKHPDLEIRNRAEICLKQIEKGGMATLVSGAAIRMLGRRGAPGAAELLLLKLPSVAGDPLADDIRTALIGLALKDTKPEPALLTALSDKLAIRRGAAGVALAHVGSARGAVRKLLADPNREVKLLVALALVKQHEKAAVPVLVAQMDQPLVLHAGEAERILFCLAGQKSPRLDGDDESSFRKYREAWEGWWKEEGARIDLSVIDNATRFLGHTAVVLLDDNQIIDLDATGKERWKIDRLQMPLDIEPLPGDRVLVAEYRGNRVTERNSKGEVLWEKKVPEPLVAQRLCNGNTFIATREGVIEVDQKGNEVFSYSPVAGQEVMRARKLTGGDILLVTQLGGAARLVRIDRFGNPVRTFGGIEVKTSGGRLDVTPSGNVLIPEMNNNRVCEFEPDGKLVRAIPVPEPITALSTPSGTVLVTSMREKDYKAVEINRADKEVWQYRRETRVTRAVRY